MGKSSIQQQRTNLNIQDVFLFERRVSFFGELVDQFWGCLGSCLAIFERSSLTQAKFGPTLPLFCQKLSSNRMTCRDNFPKHLFYLEQWLYTKSNLCIFQKLWTNQTRFFHWLGDVVILCCCWVTVSALGVVWKIDDIKQFCCQSCHIMTRLFQKQEM